LSLTFSALTPTFNYGRFLPDAIESVSRQKFGGRVEHLIQDAQSSDATADYLASLGADHVRWWSRPDAGQSDALNMLLAEASGEWIAWLNADDFYLEGAFACIEEVVEANPRVDVVIGDAMFVDVDGCLTRRYSAYNANPRVLRDYRCYIPSCSTFIRRSALTGFQWDTKLRSLMDWDLWLWLVGGGAEFVHVPRPIGAFRRHADQVTQGALSVTHPEVEILRERYGLRTTRSFPSRAMGRVVHMASRARTGAYARDLGAVPRRGGTQIWWPADKDGTSRRGS